jgi:ubiquinone/menaquinone biosynthesis C-methylase UbiE
MDPEAIRAFEHARWERAASVYAASFGVATRKFCDALLDAAGVGAGTQMLDLACGTGVVAGTAATRGAVVCGVDFSAAMLAEARAGHPSVEFVQGDAEAVPLPDARFDAVVSNFGLHHVPRPALALAEVRRGAASERRRTASMLWRRWGLPRCVAGWSTGSGGMQMRRGW